MSSTETPEAGSTAAQTDERLREFFRQRLTPAAEKLRQRGVRFFEAGPDTAGPNEASSEQTWWQPAPTWPDLSTVDDEADALGPLVDLWRAQGLDELVELGPELTELAQELEQGGDAESDLSPFLYVMY